MQCFGKAKRDLALAWHGGAMQGLSKAWQKGAEQWHCDEQICMAMEKR
jgi:hypothetical protein